ncbi:MAG: alpha-hydroxy-acid oxidizing protein [Hydrogenophilaceae bacterium]|nr:alpha-hydroxy-acid oxidizing protein [Hydrogenophilaceae bacterium]
MSQSRTLLSSLSHIPRDIHCAQDYEFLAQRFIAEPSYAYIAGGSGHDATLAANRKAFSEISIWPRLLRDVTDGHTRLHLLNREFAHPILLAPLAFQKLAHPSGELETARAAAATDTCMVCSTLSSTSLEEVAQYAGQEKWFQLYFQPRREVTLDLVKRAEAAGYTALVVTLDASVQAPSLRSQRAGFRMPADVRPTSLLGYPAPDPPALPAGASMIFQGMMAEAPTWEDLAWLLDQTALPVLVKGVLHPEDGARLQTLGMAGLVVSNHGGRTLDGVPASLEVLPRIRQAVGPAFPLLLDSGIRSGADVFKALALGADAVMIGRLQVYAMAVAGALGVAHMLKLLREELELCMALACCPTLADIGPEMILR